MTKGDIYCVLFGRHVRRLRGEASLELTELAERSGLDVELVEQIENGKHSPSLVTLGKLCTGLRVRPSAIFEAVEAGLVLGPELEELVGLLQVHPEFPVRELTALVRAVVEKEADAEQPPD